MKLIYSNPNKEKAKFDYKIHSGDYLLFRKSKMTGLISLEGWYGRNTAYRLARDFNLMFSSSALYYVVSPPQCERCYKKRSIILWHNELAVCKDCWKILLGKNGR
jgi:hypothetical protein